MNDILTFAGYHPIVFMLSLWCITHFLWSLTNRVLRTIKVTSRGWPPSHLDADGDWKPEPESET